MKQRFNMREIVPGLYKHLALLEKAISEAGMDKSLLELIKIRASQINKCAYCIDVHTKDALTNGESSRRIFALSAWRESPLFSDAEKSVLQLTEEVTLIHLQGLSDETYKELEKYYSTDMIANMVMAAIAINAWNRSAISSLIKYE